MIAASDTLPSAMNFVVGQLEAMMPEEKPFTKGTLVKALAGTVEGDPEKLGLGIVVIASMFDGSGLERSGRFIPSHW